MKVFEYICNVYEVKCKDYTSYRWIISIYQRIWGYIWTFKRVVKIDGGLSDQGIFSKALQTYIRTERVDV